MKNLFYILLITFSCQLFSQVNVSGLTFTSLDPHATTKNYKNTSTFRSRIVGSPYLVQQFMKARVDHVEQVTSMRYNVYADEFEFITDKKDTLILDKIKDLSTITFINTNTKYQLVTYINADKTITGYLIELTQKSIINLYKKEVVRLSEEKIAKTTLETSMPAKYFKAESNYYLSLKSKGIIEFPNSKKRLVKQFSDKKEPIEAFIKQNNIDFDVESDLVRITEFLDTLFN